MVNVSVQESDNFSLIEFSLSGAGEVISPEDLKKIEFPEVNLAKGVILSGRLPVWFFSAAVHHYHPAAWVATFDPRLVGGVVVARHSPNAPQIGSVIYCE